MSVLDVTTTGRQQLRETSFARNLERGRFPSVELRIIPIEDPNQIITIDRFLSYEFNSSVLTPIDNFSFTFSAPDSESIPTQTIRPGDIVILRANNFSLSTGFIDTVGIEVDAVNGEMVTIQGRDYMAQLEDNDSIAIDSAPIYSDNFTVEQVIKLLVQNTRIKNVPVDVRNAPTGGFLFATEPQETKLSSLLRYLEPLNILVWMSPNANIIVGKPDMAQDSRGRLFISKTNRRSNVLSMMVTRNTTKIANIIVPIWSGQEGVVDRVGQEQAIYNPRREPTRLRKQGHTVIKTVVVSNSTGNDPQSQAQVVNTINSARSNLLQAYATRELARQNMDELQVSCEIGGHYDENGVPYRIDSVYKIENDRAAVDEKMYLYEVNYTMDEQGQRSTLNFCPLGSIVAGVKSQ